MHLPAFIAAIRDVVAADVDGIKGVHYPAPNNIEAIETPALVLYAGSPDADIQILHKGPGEQEWTGTIRGQLITAREGDTPEEFARIDDLLTPLVDAFGVDGDGGTVIERHPDLFGYGVYQCLITRQRPTLLIEYGALRFYGAEIFWSFRFDRITGSA